MSAYDIHAWAEFGVALLGAAAVLAGLVFVAVSINLEKVLEVPGLPGRAGESVIMFVGVLVATLFLLVPGQSNDALGVELAVTGASVAAALLVIAVAGIKLTPHLPLSWRITRIVTALASGIPISIAGVSLLAESGGGLYWLVAGALLALIAGIGNAWVLLVEIVRDERYRPAGGRERR